MLKIIADHREKPSGAPELLIQKNAEVCFYDTFRWRFCYQPPNYSDQCQ